MLITGASSGIGKECAIEAAKRGYELILTARRKEKLKELNIPYSVATDGLSSNDSLNIFDIFFMIDRN